MLELQAALSRVFSREEALCLQLRFLPRGALPAAAIVQFNGQEFRLEKDLFDSRWTIATNEAEPRLLDRVDESGLTIAELSKLVFGEAA